MRLIVGLAAMVLGVCLGGCDRAGSDGSGAGGNAATEADKAREPLAVSIAGEPVRVERRNDGLLVEVYADGKGAPIAPGQTAVVDFEMRLSDGTVLDSSEARRAPLRVALVQGRAIPGLQAGLEGMRVGGVRRLMVPAKLAYGDVGRPPIPPRADLVFDVRLVQIAQAE